MTKAEVKAELDKRGIAYDDDQTKAELKAILDDIIGNEGDDAINENEKVSATEEVKVEKKKAKVKEKDDMPGQASLIQCLRQLAGKRFDGK